MGNYNPRAPRILGEEWVSIRDEQLQYAPGVNSVELGTSYVQATAQRLRSARFYANELSGKLARQQCALVNIYSAGQEDQTGPIRELLIPVNNVGTTGTGISFSNAFSDAISLVDALYQPSDNKLIEIDYAAGVSRQMAFFFAVNEYPELANKRILNVSLVYSGYVDDYDPAFSINVPINFINPTPFTPMTSISQQDNAGNNQRFQAFNYTNTGSLDQLGTSVANSLRQTRGSAVIGDVNLGDVNNFWDPTSLPGSSNTPRMPWRYVDLQRFEASSGANRQFIHLLIQLPATAYTPIQSTIPRMFLDYMALRVIYCEEKRIAYGARTFKYFYQTNVIQMRDTSFNADPVLPAGTYLPTLSFVNPGEIDQGLEIGGEFPKLNALRELYQIPSHLGTKVNVPFPLHERLGETFVSETTHVLPQVSLHASGGTFLEPHVYGRQVAAQVYGVNTATQDIYDDISGVSATYPWVRYYARRFGDTTIPLTLTGVGGLSGSTAAITVAEFDALDEILDGWKEITLRFATPPAMGAVGGFPAWTWSAVSETSGNRWEVLGAAAPSISGLPGGSSLYTQAPAADRLGVATYQPTSGDTVELTWMPHGINGPWVTGATVDAGSDAVLIFAQDMPTVTGFVAINATQALTGIGQDCGVDPCCIPTDIVYNQITWSATSSAVPASGFGYYELQRMDTVETNWETIMKSSSPTGAIFNDYEARVGILSSYRIRAVDILEFPGPWSSEVTATIPSPGVSGGCLDDGHVLIFTSNERQTGSINLAYSSAWMDQQVSEDFAFPEAGFVQLQLMYNKDFYTAFRPLERGGERFSRTVLVQAAAIAPETLADFTALRDMAWDTVNYICVRDEDGNRWFATVIVPAGRVLRDRRLYLAPVDIIEVTATPTPVDPYA